MFKQNLLKGFVRETIQEELSSIQYKFVDINPRTKKYRADKKIRDFDDWLGTYNPNGPDVDVFYNNIHLGRLSTYAMGYGITSIETPTGTEYTFVSGNAYNMYKTKNDAAEILHTLWKASRNNPDSFDYFLEKLKELSRKEEEEIRNSMKDKSKDQPSGGNIGEIYMKKSKLKEFVKRTLEAVEELGNSKKGVSPDKLKHKECPKCKNAVTTLKSTKPPMWGCDKCKHQWEESVNEEHGDVHYWGAQPKDKQHKISTGYKKTLPLKESINNQNLRNLIIEAAREVAREVRQYKK